MGGLNPFVLLTPILVLGVLALLAFVGCDVVFGIPAIPPPTCVPLEHLTALPGDRVVLLTWRAFPPGASPARIPKA